MPASDALEQPVAFLSELAYKTRLSIYFNMAPRNWTGEIRDIAAYCTNFEHFAFLSNPLYWGVGKMYNVHLGLIGKRVVDFLLMIIEIFSFGVTAEALRAKIDRKLAILLNAVSLTQNFR